MSDNTSDSCSSADQVCPKCGSKSVCHGSNTEWRCFAGCGHYWLKEPPTVHCHGVGEMPEETKRALGSMMEKIAEDPSILDKPSDSHSCDRTLLERLKGSPEELRALIAELRKTLAAERKTHAKEREQSNALAKELFRIQAENEELKAEAKRWEEAELDTTKTLDAVRDENKKLRDRYDTDWEFKYASECLKTKKLREAIRQQQDAIVSAHSLLSSPQMGHGHVVKAKLLLNDSRKLGVIDD